MIKLISSSIESDGSLTATLKIGGITKTIRFIYVDKHTSRYPIEVYQVPIGVKIGNGVKRFLAHVQVLINKETGTVELGKIHKGLDSRTLKPVCFADELPIKK